MKAEPLHGQSVLFCHPFFPFHFFSVSGFVERQSGIIFPPVITPFRR